MASKDPTIDRLNQMQRTGDWVIGGNLWIDGANGGAFYSNGVQITDADFESLVGKASSIAFSIAKGGSSNICIVTLQANDCNGNPVAAAVMSEWWLSDASTGAGLTATTASGAVGAGAAGVDLLVNTAKKNTRVLTSAAGVYNLSITDTAKTGFYVAVKLGDKLYVSRQLVAGDYDSSREGGMSYGLKLITPPANEPVALADMKTWLRIDSGDTSQDAPITELITSARDYCEKETGRAFCTQTWQMTLDRFPIGGTPAIWQQYSFGYWQQRIPQVALASQWWPDKASIRVPKPPCQAVSFVKYIAADLSLQTLDPSLYLVDTNQELARITPSYGNIWPILTQQLGAVTIQFVAGYSADGTSVPDEVKTAIRMWVTGAYEHRDGITPATLAAADRILDSVRTGEYT